nr:MAG TPA_asm: hypothetical protein [Caudoviricetes sp.]
MSGKSGRYFSWSLSPLFICLSYRAEYINERPSGIY